MPEKGFRMQRTPRSVKGKGDGEKSIKGKSDTDSNVCMCSEKLQTPVVAGTGVRAASFSDVNASMACSVVAAIKHVIAPVCRWRGSDVDDIRVEGNKLNTYVAKASQTSDDTKAKLIEQHSVFGRNWKVVIGPPVCRDFGSLVEETVLYEKLQEHLMRDGMCLLNLHSAVSAIIHHGDYFVVVDCGTRDSSGLATNIGMPVAVFNTCLDDLMLHVRNLKKSLEAQWFGISSISVKAGQVDPDMEDGATVFTDSDVAAELSSSVRGTFPSDAFECHDATGEVVEVVSGKVAGEHVNLKNIQVAAEPEDCTSIRVENSVRGSFHQGNDRFKYAGLQCMAIGLVGIAKHTVGSVFSWRSEDLDNVVVLGDRLYTSLRDNNKITGSSELLCVSDLPKWSFIDGQQFEFEYGDFVTGVVGRCG